ncbi:MAG: hypothetical protein IJ557_04290 [Bacteroidaceae bacterium]|jgi:hypothetical protein|nr:hypothetical protein [Bacteroidaceae bacterium]
MKTYIKPQTHVCIVKARTAMMQVSVQGNSGMKNGGSAPTSDQRVKDRDVWSDGFWD